MSYKICLVATAAFLAATVTLLSTRTASAQSAATANAQPSANATAATRPAAPGIIFKLRSTSERMEMTVNTSRIITIEQQVPQVQVNNPEVLQLTVLSPTQIQIAA